MIEASGGLGLVPQPLASLEIVSAGGEQELDRDRALELRVVSQEHFTHAARSEGAAEIRSRRPSGARVWRDAADRQPAAAPLAG